MPVTEIQYSHQETQSKVVMATKGVNIFYRKFAFSNIENYLLFSVRYTNSFQCSTLNPKAMENNLSITIPPETLQAVKDALQQIQSMMAPYVVALTPEQRKEIPKVNDGTEPFMGKVVEYSAANAQFLPAYVSLVELQKDWNVFSEITPLLRTMDQIRDNFSDTAMLAGSEAYKGALSYYQSVKQAAKVNAPDAKAIYEDLSKRFTKQGKRTNSPSIE